MKSISRPSLLKLAGTGAAALLLLAAVPALSGCKDQAVTSQRAQAGSPVTRQAPPERPELNQSLFDIIIADDEDGAIQLVKDGASVNAVDHRGVSALHFAARSTMPRLTRLLLEYGADVNVTLPTPDGTDSGVQPIHWAGRAGASDREGAEETVDVLLEYGADINARSAGGTLPVTYAIMLGNEQWRQFLISRGSLPE